jgi:hypothetical protein
VRLRNPQWQDRHSWLQGAYPPSARKRPHEHSQRSRYSQHNHE